MTDKERRLYVERALMCIKPIIAVRRGICGCVAGQIYNFEYIHDTGNDGEYSNAYFLTSDGRIVRRLRLN